MMGKAFRIWNHKESQGKELFTESNGWNRKIRHRDGGGCRLRETGIRKGDKKCLTIM